MHNPQHILITGASSGIGATLALEYASPERYLSLHGRNMQRLNEIADKARALGAHVAIHVGDVTDAQDLSAWIGSRDKERPLDLIIANAGISGGTANGIESPLQVRAIFETNVIGVFNTIHPCIPLLLQRKCGQIAIVSSLASFRGFPGAPAYCASKAAVRIYGEGLRGELAEKGIKVNVICPGFIKTPMTDANRFAMPFLMSASHAAKIIRQGLAVNRARIAFPWIMYTAVQIFINAPQALIDLLARKTPKK